MPLVSVDATEIPIKSFEETTPRPVGTVVTAFDQGARSNVRGHVREFSGTTAYMDAAEYVTIRTLLFGTLGARVVGGDLVTITEAIIIPQGEDMRPNGTLIQRSIKFDFRET